MLRVSSDPPPSMRAAPAAERSGGGGRGGGSTGGGGSEPRGGLLAPHHPLCTHMASSRPPTPGSTRPPSLPNTRHPPCGLVMMRRWMRSASAWAGRAAAAAAVARWYRCASVCFTCRQAGGRVNGAHRARRERLGCRQKQRPLPANNKHLKGMAQRHTDTHIFIPMPTLAPAPCTHLGTQQRQQAHVLLLGHHVRLGVGGGRQRLRRVEPRPGPRAACTARRWGRWRWWWAQQGGV